MHNIPNTKNSMLGKIRSSCFSLAASHTIRESIYAWSHDLMLPSSAGLYMHGFHIKTPLVTISLHPLTTFASINSAILIKFLMFVFGHLIWTYCTWPSTIPGGRTGSALILLIMAFLATHFTAELPVVPLFWNAHLFACLSRRPTS
jgi:hypothetical protein